MVWLRMRQPDAKSFADETTSNTFLDFIIFNTILFQSSWKAIVFLFILLSHFE